MYLPPVTAGICEQLPNAIYEFFSFLSSVSVTPPFHICCPHCSFLIFGSISFPNFFRYSVSFSPNFFCNYSNCLLSHSSFFTHSWCISCFLHYFLYPSSLSRLQFPGLLQNPSFLHRRGLNHCPAVSSTNPRFYR